MSNSLKEIIQLLSAALAPITAIIALGIAYRQYRLEQVKFRHELYEKRLAIFNSTMKLLGIIMGRANVEFSELFAFLQETNQAYFLLGKEIADYLEEIYKKGVDLQSQKERIRNEAFKSDEDRNRLIDENTKLLKWFTNQMLVAREKFSQHLGLGK